MRRRAMAAKMRVVFPDSPDFKKLLASGQIVSGADVEAQMSVIKKGEQPGPDDEIVQPKSRK
jgi:hypothetical protein